MKINDCNEEKSGNWGLDEIDCHRSHKGQCTWEKANFERKILKKKLKTFFFEKTFLKKKIWKKNFRKTNFKKRF